MITWVGRKVTANEFAKLLIEDRGFTGLVFWDEFTVEEYKLMTQKEKDDINIALDRQNQRVRDFLGWDELYRKVMSRPKVKGWKY